MGIWLILLVLEDKCIFSAFLVLDKICVTSQLSTIIKPSFKLVHRF